MILSICLLLNVHVKKQSYRIHVANNDAPFLENAVYLILKMAPRNLMGQRPLIRELTRLLWLQIALRVAAEETSF